MYFNKKITNSAIAFDIFLQQPIITMSHTKRHIVFEEGTGIILSIKKTHACIWHLSLYRLRSNN